MPSSDLDPPFQKALALLHSKSKDSAEQMKILVEEFLRFKTGREVKIKLPINPPLRMGSKFGGSDHSLGESESKRKTEKSEDVFDIPLSMRDAKRLKTDGKAESPPKRGPNTEEADDLVSAILDFACLVCKGLDVSSGNQLVECHECTALYHQECHKPSISDQEAMEFVCSTCVKSPKKSAYKSSSLSSSSSKSTKPEGIHKVSSSASLSSKDSGYKKSDKDKGSSSKSSSSISSRSTSGSYSPSSKTSSSISRSGGSSGSSSKSSVTSISATGSSFLQDADKRLQMLKKKAATKLQEKRKGK